MTQDPAARIRTQFERMRELARSPGLSARNERVSRWSPAEHLDHLAKVSMSVVRRLGQEGVQPSPRGINVIGRLLLILGWLPRGLGKAPERLTGTPCTAEELDAALTRLASAFDALPSEALLPSRGPIVPHPRFGGLTPPQALRFVVVHTDHHLKIIRDILSHRI